MATKRTRRKTGSNSYETITHNNQTGRTTRTRTVKLPGGVTHSSSTSNRTSGVRRTSTFTNNDGWFTRKTYSTPKTVKNAKSRTSKSRSSKGSSFTAFILSSIVFIILYIFYN